MGSGPSASSIATQNQLTSRQLDLAQQQQAQSQEQYGQYKTLSAPAISKYTALATGSPQAALTAAAPEIGQLQSGYAAARQAILNNTPPGAARDQALANLERQTYTGTAGALASEVQQAPDILANIGAGMGAFSLQEVGAALSGYSGASSSNNQLMQAQNAAKANTTGLITGLAGAAGTGLGAFKLPSDRRLKTNIRPYTVLPLSLLARLGSVQVVRFDYVDGPKNQVGVIAQEIQEIFPEVVSRREDGFLQVDYAMLAAIALGATAELAARAKEMDDRLNRRTIGVRAVGV